MGPIGTEIPVRSFFEELFENAEKFGGNNERKMPPDRLDGWTSNLQWFAMDQSACRICVVFVLLSFTLKISRFVSEIVGFLSNLIFFFRSIPTMTSSKKVEKPQGAYIKKGRSVSFRSFAIFSTCKFDRLVSTLKRHSPVFDVENAINTKTPLFSNSMESTSDEKRTFTWANAVPTFTKRKSTVDRSIAFRFARFRSFVRS